MHDFWKTFSQQMKPRYHEISAYLIAFSFCWLLVFHPEFRQGYYIFLTGNESMSPFFLALGLIETGGLLLSLFHVFVRRKKTATEKILIGWFVMGTSAVASFVAGSEMLSSQSSFAVIFLVWNILMCIWLLLQMVSQKYEISDDNASFLEIIITTVLQVVILLFSDQYLRLSWAVTLSVCIFYSTSIVFLTTWIVHNFNLQLPSIRKKK